MLKSFCVLSGSRHFCDMNKFYKRWLDALGRNVGYYDMGRRHSDLHRRHYHHPTHRNTRACERHSRKNVRYPNLKPLKGETVWLDTRQTRNKH